MSRPDSRFVICVSSGGYPASLEARKVYVALPDPDAEERELIRVVDESGEDYLYPGELFMPVRLSRKAARIVLGHAEPG